MKYCLSSHQSLEYLKEADEIKVLYKDRSYIYDLIEKLEDKTYILEINSEDKVDIQEIYKYYILTKEKLICKVPSYSLALECKEKNIPFFYGYPVNNFQLLKSLIDLGSYYVILEAPLFFNMPLVKRMNARIRVVPNRTTTEEFPIDSARGTWIRPEDLETNYSKYVDSVEFEFNAISQEQALFRIYKKSQQWNGPMHMLFIHNSTDPIFSCLNGMIHPEVSLRRINCGQRCMSDSRCKICNTAFSLANPNKIDEYLDAINNN